MDNGTAGEHPALYAILTIVGATHKIVKRIYRRKNRPGKRRRYSVMLQEACYHYWDQGQRIAYIRFEQNTKTTYDSVFNYYRKELQALGVSDSELFRLALKARSQRISRIQSRNPSGK